MRIAASLTGALLFLVMIVGCGPAPAPTPDDVLSGPDPSPSPDRARRAAHDEARDQAHAHAEAQAQAQARRHMPSAQMGMHQVLITHARTVFMHSYAVGGLWPGLAGYEPGEWTKFTLRTREGEPVTMERALLKVTDDGEKWWRFTWETRDGAWVYEALVDPDKQEVLRLRGKQPNGQVKEIPVQKGTSFTHPRQLTDESIKGAVEATTEIETQAGSFTAKRARFAGTAGQGAVDWWLNESVPGGVVKYQASDADGVTMYGELVDYGSGATTQLDSFEK